MANATEPEAASVGQPADAGAQPDDVTAPQPLAGVLDEAFDLYKRHFLALAIIVAVALVPIELFQHAVVGFWIRPLAARASGQSDPDPSSVVVQAIGWFIFGEPRTGVPGLISLILHVLVSAPIAIAISDVYLGRTPDWRGSWSRARPYLLKNVGAHAFALLAAGAAAAGCLLAVSIVMTVFISAASAVGLGNDASITGIVLLAAIPYALVAGFLARSFLFLTPLTVLEGLKVSEAMQRNSQLVGQRRFWRSWLAIAGLPLLVFLAPATVGWAVENLLGLVRLPGAAAWAVETSLGTATRVLFEPYWVIFLTLLYYDYRVRREGFDVQLVALMDRAAIRAPGEGSR